MTREGQGVTLIPLSVRTRDFPGGEARATEGRGPLLRRQALRPRQARRRRGMREAAQAERSEERTETYRLKQKSRGESLCFFAWEKGGVVFV